MRALRKARWLGVVGLLFSAACVAQRPSLTPQQQRELATYKSQLADPQRTAKTKLEAAGLLLQREYPQARAAVLEFLSDEANPPARKAVADAIAASAQLDRQFVKPLLAMLTGADAEVRPHAANALAAYKNDGVMDELIELAGSRKTDRGIRLVTIAAMGRVLDHRAADALVQLTGDRDEDISDAACDALAKLTRIRAFARQPRKWQQWWAKSKDKPQSEWLADLAERLAGANIELENENANLRRQLAVVMKRQYDVAADVRKDALLSEMLEYPVAEVRLAGVLLVQQRLAGGKALSEALTERVAIMVEDASADVRRAAAVALANIGGQRAVEIITGRLDVEEVPAVREMLYQAAGLLRDANVWDRLVAGIENEDRPVAAAAAAALARVAQRNGSDKDRRAAAAAALNKRYRQAKDNSTGLREALLAAMGALKDKELAELLISALKDPAPTIRLRAIEGLEKLALPEYAAAVAPLIADPDRGVRRAAISAVGALNGADHLDDVLGRTAPAVEPDAAVRQQAWTVAMALLKKSDTEAFDFKKLADQLAGRPDAKEYHIQLLKLWLEKIPDSKAQQQAPVRQRLGEALLAAGRPAEAAGELAAAYELLKKAGSDEAAKVRLRWIQALLAAADISAIKTIAEDEDPAQFAPALQCLIRHLETLKTQKQWGDLVRLARAAAQQLAGRLDDSQRSWLDQALQEGIAQQRMEDRQRVATLLPQLTAADDAARQAAERALVEMKARAVGPLVEELGKLLSAENPDAAAEAAVLKILAALAPQLKGYDPQAEVDQKLATLQEWLKQLGS